LGEGKKRIDRGGGGHERIETGKDYAKKSNLHKPQGNKIQWKTGKKRRAKTGPDLLKGPAARKEHLREKKKKK